MARQGSNIISFDDAKRFASSYASGRSSADSQNQSDAFSYASARAARPEAQAFAPVDAFDDLSVFESPFSRSRSTRQGSYARRGGAVLARAGESRASRQAARSQRATSAPAASGGAPRAALEVYESDEAESDDARASKRARQKKRRLKDKASRMFANQFGADDTCGQASSRAAVYKAEMGRNHRRAFADLGGAAQGRTGAAGKAGKSKKFSSTAISRIAVAAGCAVCAAAVMLFLYPTAQQVYIESREEARLQAEYDALMQRNEAMADRIEYLKTDEGIQDVARQQLGWVKEGETAVVVEGLPEQGEEASGVNIQIASGSIPAPDTWYSTVLDAVFGYAGAAPANGAQQEGTSGDAGQQGA